MSRGPDILAVARAEALFTSELGTGAHPSRVEATSAIRCALRANGGVRGCVARLADEYGDHPDTAVRRMRWALTLVDDLFAHHAGSRP
jgi:hypothetical protein